MTPGPHRVGIQKFKNEREKGEEHFSVFDQHSACLAHVFNEGDATLYAAAPDLLAACEDAIEELRTDENYVSDNGGEVEFLVNLRAAIAKARSK